MEWMLEIMSIAYGCKLEVMSIAYGMYARDDEYIMWDGC